MSCTNAPLFLALAIAALLVGEASAARKIAVADVAGSANKMCAGYDDASDDYKIYYGPCASAAAFETGAPYFTSELTDVALVSGGDSAYLTNASEAELLGDPTKLITKSEEGKKAGDAEYAYVAAAAAFGTTTGDLDEAGASAILGAAYYMVQKGTIKSNYNYFPVLVDGKFDKNAAACISPIEGGKCSAAGSGQTWSAGDLKFTILGQTGGTGLATKVNGKDYVGFRTHVNAGNLGSDASVYFNGQTSKTIATIGTADVTSFAVTWTGGEVTHKFPTKYNVGQTKEILNKGDPGADEDADFTTKVTSNTATRTVKIKVSGKEAGKLDIDYLDGLIAIKPSKAGAKDGLVVNERWFVYDPDVAVSGVSCAIYKHT
jgi:hypothetical protein